MSILSSYREIWSEEAESHATQVMRHNSTLLELKRAGGRHFKWFYLYIFAGNHPFLMEFGVRMRTLIPSAVRYRKSKFWQFNMVDRCYIENLFRLYLSFLLSDLE